MLRDSGSTDISTAIGSDEIKLAPGWCAAASSPNPRVSATSGTSTAGRVSLSVPMSSAGYADSPRLAEVAGSGAATGTGTGTTGATTGAGATGGCGSAG